MRFICTPPACAVSCLHGGRRHYKGTRSASKTPTNEGKRLPGRGCRGIGVRKENKRLTSSCRPIIGCRSFPVAWTAILTIHVSCSQLAATNHAGGYFVNLGTDVGSLRQLICTAPEWTMNCQEMWFPRYFSNYFISSFATQGSSRRHSCIIF